MPAMASMTVKKFDGTTDIIYDALSASGGDSSPAVWRQDTGAVAALPVGLRAAFKLATTWNGPKTARQTKFNYVRPYAVQDSTTTKYSASDRVVIDGIMTVPMAIPSTDINEAIYQACNLLAQSLVKQAASSGYAPT
jgi:hypothetical protein